MKKILSILLLVAIGFNTSAYYFFLKLRQTKVRQKVKKRIKAGLPEDELTLIYLTGFNTHEFKWVHSREFSYRGIMYDIVREEISGHETRLLHYVTDHKETALFMCLNRLASHIVLRQNHIIPLSHNYSARRFAKSRHFQRFFEIHTINLT